MSGADAACVALLERHLPQWKGAFEDATWLMDPKGDKNAVVAFARAGERLVLKVYGLTFSYGAQALGNGFGRYLARAFKLRSWPRDRLRVELAAIDAFQRAGFHTFEVVTQPGPTAVVFRFVEGKNLLGVVKGAPTDAGKIELVVPYVEDFVKRQTIAASSGERALVHPAPQLGHVMVDATGGFVHHDFEGRTNPSLPIDELLVAEFETFFGSLCRRSAVQGEVLDAATAALEGPVLERWRNHRPHWLTRFSRGAARRRAAIERVLGGDPRQTS